MAERPPIFTERPGERITADADALRQRHLTVARAGGVRLAEYFLLSAVTSVLLIRMYLIVTGYPQVGGGGFHIAHVLWGGLLMLAGALLLLLRLGRPALRLGAILSGVGFGFFIDEVGKFVTSDVNYFYQPAVAIIYVVFVGVALLLTFIQRRRMVMDERTALANALARVDEAINDPAAADARREVLSFLDRADPAEPLVPVLRERILRAREGVPVPPTRWQRFRIAIERGYPRIAARAWFPRAIVIFFVVVALAILGLGVLAFVDESGIGVSGWVQVISSVIAGVLIAIGLIRLRHSRLDAYRWFARSVLVDILVTEVFAFYDDPETALIGVAVDLAVLVTLRVAIAHEETMAYGRPSEHPGLLSI